MSSNKVPSNSVGLGALIVGLAILVIAVCIGGMLLFQSQISGTRAPSSTVAPAIVSAPTPTASASDTPTNTATPSPAPASTPTTVPTVELGTSNVFIEYILDASGSMTGTLSDGSVKIDLAKRVLTDHMRSFRPETNIGLRAFGHRLPYRQTAESCQDIELIAPVEKGQMERIVGWLQDFSAQGMTPLAASLQLAKDDFIYEAPRVNSIVMLSDGIETCEGDPCKLVEDLKAQGINFTIHVIGLDVDDPTRKQLTCIAQAGGGTYHDAKSQQDLGSALEAIKSDVTKDESIVPPGVDTPAPVPPTVTPLPSTNTPLPPTNTPVTPTNTSAPSTATPVSPTDTPVPPTITPVLPTDTAVPGLSPGGVCGRFVRGTSIDRWPYFVPNGSNEAWFIDPFMSDIFQEGAYAVVWDPYLVDSMDGGDGYPIRKYWRSYSDMQYVPGC